MTETVHLVGGVRTPVGRYGGALSRVRPDDLAALTLRALVERTGVDPARLDEVILGCANQAGEDNRNVARMAVLLAGLPDGLPAYTVNRLCASGMTAITTAHALIASGSADLVIAGGVESMSRAPWVQQKPERAFAGPGASFDTSIGWRFVNPRLAQRENATLSMPETAELVAERRAIDRDRADAFALESHRRALQAQTDGMFDDEIVEVPVTGGTVRLDEGPRADSSIEALGRLRPVVSGGAVVTAGNSSSLNDGASAVLVASDRAVRELGLIPRARIVAHAASALQPEIMGLGPVEATRKALGRAGWTVDEVDAVELNEAFASQSLACMDALDLDADRVNAWGGAIALGHPLGSSGARIVVTLLSRLERGDLRRGLATMCVGVGQGTALLVER
ncbi:3-oxoadipyl-CoA thiolase [Microbacterium sp. W4I4]|uniref:thiolase family protein n=1 Tax=Microbacterium sp. W4I4 TaxID=3042295 RepID=UPI0027845535|nr:thiolase family protein [Microbacterium sp. W4I4]MDQ0615506.1 3-oxoadipyl-CoA thiolase [Microbacterium sp. W4I4]